MNGKGDRNRVTNLTRYAKNYTKIFKNWVESRTVVPDYRKKEKLNWTLVMLLMKRQVIPL